MKKALLGSLMFLVIATGTMALLNLTDLAVVTAEAQDMPMPSAAERATLGELHQRLAEFKDGLRSAGKYSCCLTEGCDFCALAEAMCPCRGKLANGEAVCGECKMGWQAGMGSLPGVDAADVRSLPDPMAKMMMEMRNMQKGGR